MKAALVTMLVFLMLAVCAQASAKVESLCEISYPSDESMEWECQKLTWNDTPQGLFGEYWQDVLRFNRMDRRHFQGGLSIKVPIRLEDVRNFTPLPATYQDAAQEEKFILVDLSEMFLGAYENGRMVGSFPIAVGLSEYPVPTGKFQVDAVDRWHRSNLYEIEELELPYPMHYGLRFHVDKSTDGWPSYWIHGRDLPGYPVSHGCIGLYDEEMQKEYYSLHDKKVHKKHYRELQPPFLQGAKELYNWVIDDRPDSGKFHKIDYGPKVLIVGPAPEPDV